MNTIKKWLKWLSLSNPNNWEIYSEREWSIDMDGYSKPRRFYRHRKHPYFITNAFIKHPLNKIDLINKFLFDYKNKTLLMDETLFVISE